MAEDVRAQAEKDAQERVDKAAFINDQVMERLHQYDGKDAAVQPAKDARTAYPAAKPARPGKVQGDPKP